jgi:hypothetical protein
MARLLENRKALARFMTLRDGSEQNEGTNSASLTQQACPPLPERSADFGSCVEPTPTTRCVRECAKTP